jgi:hypothetical protein
MRCIERPGGVRTTIHWMISKRRGPRYTRELPSRKVILWSSREQNPGFCYRECRKHGKSEWAAPERSTVRRHIRATGSFYEGHVAHCGSATSGCRQLRANRGPEQVSALCKASYTTAVGRGRAVSADDGWKRAGGGWQRRERMHRRQWQESKQP